MKISSDFFDRIVPSLSLLILSLLLISCGESTSDNKGWQLTILNPVTHHIQTIQEADTAHKRIVINYWAEWCKPCREEIPELNRFAAAHRDTVLMLGFNFDNLSETALQTSTNRVGMSFPVLINNPAKIFTLPAIDGLPTTLILDEHGILKEKLAGPQTLASLEAALLKP